MKLNRYLNIIPCKHRISFLISNAYTTSKEPTTMCVTSLQPDQMQEGELVIRLVMASGVLIPAKPKK